MLIFDTEAHGNKVLGNYVGTDKGGAAPLGNDNSGVSIHEAPSNTIGGTTTGARNVISANGIDGVDVYGDTATGNRILSNSIFANVQQGIDLGQDGPTANDPGDADSGRELTCRTSRPLLGQEERRGYDDGQGHPRQHVQQHLQTAVLLEPQGHGRGQDPARLGDRLHHGSGNVSFAFSTKKQVRLGQNITATATGPGGNTSEFSAPKTVVAS